MYLPTDESFIGPLDIFESKLTLDLPSCSDKQIKLSIQIGREKILTSSISEWFYKNHLILVCFPQLWKYADNIMEKWFWSLDESYNWLKRVAV